MLGGSRDEGQHLFLQTDDHAVQEGTHRAAQNPPLDGAAQSRQEGLHAVPVDLGAAALFHRLFVAEGLTGATEQRNQNQNQNQPEITIADSQCWRKSAADNSHVVNTPHLKQPIGQQGHRHGSVIVF